MSDAPSRRSVARVVLLAGLALAFIGFVALGVWQIERRAWKLDLIQRVDTRIHAAPLAAPGPAQWPSVNAAHDEYRRAMVEGKVPIDWGMGEALAIGSLICVCPRARHN